MGTVDRHTKKQSEEMVESLARKQSPLPLSVVSSRHAATYNVGKIMGNNW